MSLEDRLKRLASPNAPSLTDRVRPPAELLSRQMTFQGSVRLAERLGRTTLAPLADRAAAEEGLAYSAREVSTRTQWLRESAARRLSDAAARKGQSAFFSPEETYETLANLGIFHKPKKSALRSAALEVARPYGDIVRTMVRTVRSELMRARHDIAAPLRAVGGEVERLEALDDAYMRATFAKSNELYEQLVSVLEEGFVARAIEAWSALPRPGGAKRIEAPLARELVQAMHAEDGFIGRFERDVAELVRSLVEVECKGLEAIMNAARELWSQVPPETAEATSDPNEEVEEQ